MAPELVEQAASTSVDTFARKVRDLARRISRDEGLRHHEKLRSQRAVRRWMDREGMCHTQISLDPEADARLSAVFDAAVAAERPSPTTAARFDQLSADAFMTLVTATPAPGARRPAELLVLIDLETMRTGLHETSVCETYDGQPLPPDVVRRLACEANIIPIVLDGDGRVVDVGRAKRLATADQRRALRAMHRTCAAPDCPVRFGDCDIHHLKEWNARRRHEPRQLDPALHQAPPPHPRRPMAATSQSTRRLTGGPGRPRHRSSVPPTLGNGGRTMGDLWRLGAGELAQMISRPRGDVGRGGGCPSGPHRRGQPGAERDHRGAGRQRRHEAAAAADRASPPVTRSARCTACRSP